MGLCALVLCATPVAAHAGTEADLGPARPPPRVAPQGHVGDPLLREPPLAPVGPALRQGGPAKLAPARRHLAATAAKATVRGGSRTHASASDASLRRRARPRRRSATSSAPTASRPSRSRDASPASGPPLRTASTSACSRWGRVRGNCSGTGRPRSPRRRPPTGTSSSPAVTGARGRASPGAERPIRFVRKERAPAARPGSQGARWLVVERSCPSGGRSTA